MAEEFDPNSIRPHDLYQLAYDTLKAPRRIPFMNDGYFALAKVVPNRRPGDLHAWKILRDRISQIQRKDSDWEVTIATDEAPFSMHLVDLETRTVIHNWAPEDPKEISDDVLTTISMVSSPARPSAEGYLKATSSSIPFHCLGDWAKSYDTYLYACTAGVDFRGAVAAVATADRWNVKSLIQNSQYIRKGCRLPESDRKDHVDDFCSRKNVKTIFKARTGGLPHHVDLIFSPFSQLTSRLVRGCIPNLRYVIFVWPGGLRPSDRTKTVTLSSARFWSRMVLPDPNTDAVRDEFVDRVRKRIAEGSLEDWEIEELDGHDIVEAYRNEVGGGSCMTDTRAHLVELYAVNPGKVILLVVRHPRTGREGRCLVWFDEDGNVWKDRTYPHGNTLVSQIQSEYLKQTFGRDRVKFLSNKRPSDECPVIELELPQSCAMPYMDNLSCVFIQGPPCSGKTIYVSSSSEAFNVYRLKAGLTGRFEYFSAISTEGGPFAEESLCEACETYTNPDDCVVTADGDLVCDSCLSDRYRYVERTGDYHHEDTVTWCESIGEWEVDSEVVELLDGTYIPHTHSVNYDEWADGYTLDGLVRARDADGRLYARSEDEAYYVEEDNEYFVDEYQYDLWVEQNEEAEVTA